MSSDEPQTISDITVDTQNLYREEIYTGLKVASIRKMVPIRPDGSDDPNREPLFTGQTTLMSAAGPVPVQCALDASNLEEAAAKSDAEILGLVRRGKRMPGLARNVEIRAGDLLVVEASPASIEDLLGVMHLEYVGSGLSVLAVTKMLSIWKKRNKDMKRV